MTRFHRLVILGVLAVTAGCNGPTVNNRRIDRPGPDTFTPVYETVQTHCGSLDCHGSAARAFRVFSVNGLRFETGSDSCEGGPCLSGDTKVVPQDVKDAEVTATYYSFVGIEPELTAQVFAEHGIHPERLTIVRKARGDENHKGGKAIRRDGTADNCLTGWLAGVDPSVLSSPEVCQAQDPRIPQPPQPL